MLLSLSTSGVSMKDLIGAIALLLAILIIMGATCRD